MKKFKMDNSLKEQADVICYAFSPDLLNATESELKEFIKVLSSYFPKSENGDGMYKPMDNVTYISTFNNAYSNVCYLINEKRKKNRHRQMLGISILTLIVLLATLANTIYTQ
ncbi:hypothetical protein ACK3ZK_18010 [Aeromonas caviae]